MSGQVIQVFAFALEAPDALEVLKRALEGARNSAARELANQTMAALVAQRGDESPRKSTSEQLVSGIRHLATQAAREASINRAEAERLRVEVLRGLWAAASRMASVPPTRPEALPASTLEEVLDRFERIVERTRELQLDGESLLLDLEAEFGAAGVVP